MFDTVEKTEPPSSIAFAGISESFPTALFSIEGTTVLKVPKRSFVVYAKFCLIAPFSYVATEIPINPAMTIVFFILIFASVYVLFVCYNIHYSCFLIRDNLLLYLEVVIPCY